MIENMVKNIYYKIDEERITKALKDDNYNDALILFKYSSLSKAEFDTLMKEINSDPPQERTQTQSSDIWSQVLINISSKVTSSNFEAWFKQSEAIFKDDSLTIYCTNILQRDWLEEFHRDFISQSVKEVTGKVYKIFIDTKRN